MDAWNSHLSSANLGTDEFEELPLEIDITEETIFEEGKADVTNDQLKDCLDTSTGVTLRRENKEIVSSCEEVGVDPYSLNMPLDWTISTLKQRAKIRQLLDAMDCREIEGSVARDFKLVMNSTLNKLELLMAGEELIKVDAVNLELNEMNDDGTANVEKLALSAHMQKLCAEVELKKAYINYPLWYIFQKSYRRKPVRKMLKLAKTR